jgi:hypothetical protein
VVLIDSSEAVAWAVSAELGRLGLLDPGLPVPVADRLTYLVTGDVGTFMNTALRLGGREAPAFRVDLRDQGHASAHDSGGAHPRPDRLHS